MEESKKTRQGKRSALTKRISALDRYIVEERDIAEIKAKHEEFKACFEEFEVAHDHYQSHLTEEAELIQGDQYFEEAQAAYIKSLKIVNQYIREADDQSEVSTTDSVRAVHNLAYLPKFEIDVFSGDPTKYHSFIAIFEQSVEKYMYSPDGGARLTRLLQYTDGIAKRAIQSCAIVGGEEGYEKARSILKQRFGDRHTISQALIDRLRCGKAAHKKQDIQELADELTSCVTTLNEMGKLHEIDTQRSIVDIVDRLPRYIQNRWKKSALSAKKNSGMYPDINSLLTFVCDTAEEVNDPIYGYQDRLPKTSSLKQGKSQSTRSYTTSMTPAGQNQPPLSVGMRSSYGSNVQHVNVCPLCKGNHRLFGCQKFKEKKPIDRLNFVKSKGLCENCLLGNHVTNECRKPGRCNLCGEKHTRFIHINNNVTMQTNCTLFDWSQEAGTDVL